MHAEEAGKAQHLDSQQSSLGLALHTLTALLHICNEACQEVAAPYLPLQAVHFTNGCQHGCTKGRIGQLLSLLCHAVLQIPPHT